MPRVKVDQAALRALVTNINGLKRLAREAGREALNEAGDVLFDSVVTNVSAPPVGGSASSHAAFLASRDHPYARRAGEIRYRAQGGTPGFDRKLVVHSVSGKMRRSVRSTARPTSRGYVYTVFVDERIAEHAKYVIQGTRVLLGRDVLWETAIDRRVQEAMQRAIVDVLGRQFRTQAAIRFRR